MKLLSLAIFSLLGSIQAKINEPTTSTATAAILDSTDGIARNLKLVECTVSEVHGHALPGSPQVPEQYACTTDEGDALFFDGEASALLGTGFIPGETRLALAPQAMSSDRKINVQQAMAPGAVAVSSLVGGRTRKLTTTGNKSVLVVRVVSNDYAPSQNEAKMYDDVFVDENNLRVRYDDCSNGALIFDPATGTNVNNGVLTVTTMSDLNGMNWQDCGNIAINGANALGISRDFTMIVCPDVVDFERAAAYGYLPGSISWYKSQYASLPIVQMHEIGHNLGHHHSGKGGVIYADPTCHMGNQGSWSDVGNNFCFNAAKTWANKWYESYHVTVDPTNATYEGTLVGINAIKDGTIAAGQDVVLKIASSGETDLYVMFNRKAGANNEVPQYGDQVVITEQAAETSTTSSWLAGLSETGVTTYTQSWSGSGTLTVKVCSLDTGSPGGTARILVYATGHATLSCDVVSTPAPTITPVTPEPTNTPVTPAPTKATVTSPPTNAPVTSSTTSSSDCQDNDEPFLFNGGSSRRTCSFINKKNTSNRCKKDGAAENCPVTCKTGCTCHDTEGTFLSRGRIRDCKWASTRLHMCTKRNEVRSNCPIICGVC